MSCIQIEIIQYKPRGGNPEVIQILQWSGKDIKIIMISMFKNLNDEIENCTDNYKKSNAISEFEHLYLLSVIKNSIE